MGHSDVVHLLLEHDPRRASDQDNDGWSALHLAVLRRDLATIRMLLDAGSQTLLDDEGHTAEDWLHLDKSEKNDLALDKSRGCQAVTGLRRAVTEGSVPLVELLLKLGHDINGTNSRNRTALYYAAKLCMLPMVDLLLARGANPNIVPVDRIGWEEFVSDHSVLLRLTAAGYKRPQVDDELDELIRQEFQSRKQRVVPDQSIASLLGGSTSLKPDQQNPGSFAEDFEFAATLATGLEDTGSHPKL